MKEEDWAAKHPEESAVLESYRDSPNPEERALADALTGQDRASIHSDRDLSWDFVTVVLKHLRPAEKVRGAKRDEYITKLETRARAKLPPSPSITAVAEKMVELDPKYKTQADSIRVNLHDRKAKDMKKSRRDGYLGWGEFE